MSETCNLCAKTFNGPDVTDGNPLIIGEDPGQKLLRYVGTLQRHFTAHHQQSAMALQIMAGEMLAVLVLGQFTITNSVLHGEIQALRKKMHHMVGVTITDTQLQQAVDEWVANGSKTEDVIRVLRDLRAALTEIPERPLDAGV